MSAEYEYNGIGLGSRGEAIFDRLVSQYFERIAYWIPILCELNPGMDLIIPGWNRVWNNDMRSQFSLLVGFRCFQPTCERLWGRLWCLLLPRWNVYIYGVDVGLVPEPLKFSLFDLGFRVSQNLRVDPIVWRCPQGYDCMWFQGFHIMFFWCGFQGFHTMYDACNPISREIELRGVFW